MSHAQKIHVGTHDMIAECPACGVRDTPQTARYLLRNYHDGRVRACTYYNCACATEYSWDLSPFTAEAAAEVKDDIRLEHQYEDDYRRRKYAH